MNKNYTKADALVAVCEGFENDDGRQAYQTWALEELIKILFKHAKPKATSVAAQAAFVHVLEPTLAKVYKSSGIIGPEVREKAEDMVTLFASNGTA